MRPAVLVIGCGNLLAADDAVGIHVLRRLQAEAERLPGCVLVEAGTPGLTLLQLWEGYQRVIIVDAVRSGAPPGTIHRFDGACLPRRQVLPLCAHGINVVDALELGRVLGQAPAQVRIVGVEIASEEAFREGLTPAVAAAVAPACDAVREEVLRMLGGEGPSGSARE